MKNNYIKSERMWNVCKRYVLRMFYVISILFTFGVGQMWAGEPYIEEFGIQFYESSTNRYFKTSTEIKNSLAFGNKTSDFKIVYIYANAKKNGGNLCGAMYFKWWLEGTDGDSNDGGVGYTSNSFSGDYCYEKFGTENGSSALDGIDLVQNRRPGNYTFKFYYSFEGNKDNNWACGQWFDCKYSNGDWKFTYTIPDPTITITGASSLVAGTSTNIQASISNYPVGSKITKVRVTGNIASAKETTGSATSLTVSSVVPNASGSNGITVTVTVKFGTGGTKDYTYQYNVTPPAVSDFTISATSGRLGGSGTSENPWLVTYNGSLTLGLSGATKAYADGNASPQYSTDGTNYGTTGSYISKTHSSITETTNQNWKYKARLKNNSSALYGSVKEKTVYWKVSTSSVTLHKNGGSSNGSATATHGRNTLASIYAPSKTGYNVEGYYTNEACTTKVATSAGALQPSTTYTTSGSLWNVLGAQTLYTKWSPKQYTLTLNRNTGSADGSVKVTYDSNSTSNFLAVTRTGYNCTGYWTETSGGNKIINRDGTLVAYSSSVSSYINSSGNWIYDGTPSLNAQWTPKQCTVNFDFDESDDGYGSKTGATTSVTATYDAVMTSVTPPTAKEGYAFMGYWDAADGAGTQYYKADGTSKRTWNKDTESPTTLYAYYKKAEITGITFSTAGVPGSVIAPSTSTTATATISPTPTGTTTICWRILHSNGNPLEEQPTFDPETGAAVSFTTSATSGSYLIEARLRLGSGCSGTVLDSVTSVFQVAGDHNVTVQYKDASGNTIKASEIVTGRPLAWSDDITAPDIFGYTFARWDAGDGVTIKNGDLDPVTTSTDATIKIKATYDGRLTAVYNQKNIIYFKNTLGWSSVFVNLLTGSYWDKDQGTGNKNLDGARSNKQMTLVPGETDVYYYDYGSTTPSEYVSFLDRSLNNYSGFEGTEENPVRVCYPTIPNPNNAQTEMAYFGFYSKTPMFVPSKAYETATSGGDLWNHSKARYCNSGYWTKYTPGTGYYLRIYDPNDASRLIQKIEFTSEDDLIPMTATANLEANKTYKFEVSREDQQFYSNGGSMDYDDRYGQGVAWELFRPDTYAKTSFVTTADGDYIFHLTHSAENTGHVWRLRIAAEYPIADGDYRVLYKDNVHTLWHPSAIVAKANNRKDTVSFFIRPGKSPSMKIQQATVDGSGAISWGNYSDISSSLSSLTKDSVYNICLTMNGSGAITVENVTPYTGNYYIRTDAANSKWSNYRSDPDHLMTYSEYSITHGGYSHYYCHWVTIADAYRKNVKFVIANDYSPCISDTLTRETAADEWANIGSFINASGELLRSANVRFMWDQSTNKISRAYLDPAKNDDNFLVLSSADSKIANASEVVQTAVVFSDNENWIYEANVKAKPNAQIKLVATWGDAPTTIVQYFKGTSSTTETLITGDTEDTKWYNIRLIYDYKTNRLVSALLPSGNITTETPINADVMFIREHQGDIAQLTFSGSGSLTEIKTAYGVIRFNKWTLNNKEKTGSHTPLASPLSRYERDLFYISFPFRVNLNEVFGFGTYGVHWIVQEYDGAARATNGLWKDTPTYWRFITNRKGKYLEPNVGYLLALDLDELGETSSVWTNGVENVELFFPSCETMPDIKSSSVTHTLPSHECTINRPTPQGDRRKSDSHWNIMSVPTYVNVNNPSFTNTTWTATIGPKFLYTWNADDNTLTPTTATGFNYHAMHAYTVQYYGNVTWATSVSPSSIVARKQAEPSAYEWCLELQQNDKMIDRTYVRMSDEEEVTTGFEFGYDMSKSIEWAKANIYTFIGTEWVAGNSLPLETEQTTIIPVGLTLAAAGDYTFAMPAGTHGVGVTLVDTQTNERTNLSAGMTQTVTLTQGDHLDRFFLEISPIHNAPTDIEAVTSEGLPANGARKVLIDGILYIVKGDKLYDVRGTMIK